MDRQPSPGSGGPLIDPDGVVWTMRRRDVDLRVVRRALRTIDSKVLMGTGAGFDLCWVAPGQRTVLWQELRKNYWHRPTGTQGAFAAYEFVNDAGGHLLYIEKVC